MTDTKERNYIKGSAKANVHEGVEYINLSLLVSDLDAIKNDKHILMSQYARGILKEMLFDPSLPLGQRDIALIAMMSIDLVNNAPLSQKTMKFYNDLANNNLPSWMFNARKGYEDGKDTHLLTGDLKFKTENDIKRLKTI